MPDPAARRKFEAMVAAAFADGFLAESEKVVLQQKADRLGLSTREMHEVLGLGQQRKLSIAVPATAAERETLLEDLIEVVAADGRVEPAEYSLLARFAETLKIGLPELRQRVNRRMQGGADGNTRTQVRRQAPSPSPPPPPPAPAPAPLRFMQPAAPTSQEFPKEPKVGDLPPVTLQLLKQSVMFDNEADSIASIGRTLGIPAEAAAQIRQAILAAFPELKSASGMARPSPRI